ncbi:MAG TPA: pyridoxal-dependent decarboxylase [Bacteroidales bacterium]|nr:pyridoxal-dependent decarboxylase [Bacteroidales bacterium]HRR92689.1 pyridoxal-dependent decarboxylase [Bacteroidales bacterium]HRT90807.1 pyridoxal-dependent decarboxylase [Bacteroidales bacterium]
MTSFDLTPGERKKTLELVIDILEKYYSGNTAGRVTPPLEVAEIRAEVESADFDNPLSITGSVTKITEALGKYIVHLGHPMYYGLFNPRPNFPSVLADLITAVYNPQLAAWSHSPWASEVELYLVKQFGQKIGFPYEATDGVFATGGAEANITAVQCALNRHFPEYGESGCIAFRKRPLVYCSAEAHHSVIRAAKVSGLGRESVRMIQVNDRLEMDTRALEETINSDISAGHEPFMIVGTAGTTGTGAIDNLEKIAETAGKYNLWFHTDSAWGGAALLVPEMKPLLKGIAKSDSVTLDVHKWLSVTMSASMFITRHSDILGRTFRITTDYMPREAGKLEVVDPFSHSIQWSRRFTGLKLYLSLMVFGWKGYEEVIRRMTAAGSRLKEILVQNNWEILNSTPMPLVCFTDRDLKDDPAFIPWLCSSVVASGNAWVSVYPVKGLNAIRACITNYNTSETHLGDLVKIINEIRSDYLKKKTSSGDR